MAEYHERHGEGALARSPTERLAGHGPRPGRFGFSVSSCWRDLVGIFSANANSQLVEQTRGLINKATEDVATKTPNPADVSADLTSSVDTVRTTLQGITDPASARAALPKLQQATEQLDRINSLAAQLPPSSRKELASLVEASMPALNRLCDRALSNPQIAGLAKPTIDALRAKLQSLAQA